MGKYRACKTFDVRNGCMFYWVECTHPVYGYPGVLIPTQPRFSTYEEAVSFAKHLNNDNEQLALFDADDYNDWGVSNG